MLRYCMLSHCKEVFEENEEIHSGEIDDERKPVFSRHPKAQTNTPVRIDVTSGTVIEQLADVALGQSGHEAHHSMSLP